MPQDLDTSHIRNWRSILTFIIFVFTNIIVLYPFRVPIYVPRIFADAILDSLSALRIIPPRQDRSQDDDNHELKPFVRLHFPMNFVTAPLIADLFLLAILAIGRQEVHDGTIGADNISPIDILTFFLTLAYIAISIDASGLIRYLAFKVLQWGGKVGHRLFFYLYAFFFVLGSFIGNDPIILSGTAFLAYMTRVSSNVQHPRAWIHTQFAVANTASAILVTSNPTNLVLAGAFNIKFIHYTANMIVPVVITAVVLFPFLLYIVFADETLIPLSIEMHTLPEGAKNKRPVNPNIPHARQNIEEREKNFANDEQVKLVSLSLEEIMNPFVDKGGAAFGAVLISVTLITILALNAASNGSGEHPVFWVTLPAAFVMFCWDLAFGWHRRRETREIAHQCRREFENLRSQRANKENEAKSEAELQNQSGAGGSNSNFTYADDEIRAADSIRTRSTNTGHLSPSTPTLFEPNNNTKLENMTLAREMDNEKSVSNEVQLGPIYSQIHGRSTLVSIITDAYRWSQETFPTATAVLAHLPFALVPFALSMFVLVQGLVTKGWVPVFAHGWDHWVNKTGTIGSIGGMGFISVVLCNFAGTNIGATILLSRIIQGWQEIHRINGIPISDRTFWATVYSMALGVNYGAFSTTFSASLAGLLWRDILARKHISVRPLDFARHNLPIIVIAMTVGCVTLVGEVYIFRDDSPYDS